MVHLLALLRPDRGVLRQIMGNARLRKGWGGSNWQQVKRDKALSQTNVVSLKKAQCPLLALSGHSLLHRTCPLSGVKQTWGAGGGSQETIPARPRARWRAKCHKPSLQFSREKLGLKPWVTAVANPSPNCTRSRSHATRPRSDRQQPTHH